MQLLPFKARNFNFTFTPPSSFPTMTTLSDVPISQYRGYVKCSGDALICFEAALSGSPYIPRIRRRWSYPERLACIRSGTILVYNEEESDIKRWTDGRNWTPSRISKNFLVYRERYSGDEVAVSHVRYPGWLVGSIKNEAVRADGLIRKSMSISIEGIKYSLVSYYLPEDVLSGKLCRPSQFPLLSSIPIRDSILDCVVTRDDIKTFTGDDGIRQPIFEPDDPVVHKCQDIAPGPEDVNDQDTAQPLLTVQVPLPPFAHGRTASQIDGTPRLTTTALPRLAVQLRLYRPQRTGFNPYRRAHDVWSQGREFQPSSRGQSDVELPLQSVDNSPTSSTASDSYNVSPVSLPLFSPPKVKAEQPCEPLKHEEDRSQRFNDHIFPTDGLVNRTLDIEGLPAPPLEPVPSIVPGYWCEGSASESTPTPPVLGSLPSFGYFSHVVGGDAVWLTQSANRPGGYTSNKFEHNNKPFDNSFVPPAAFYVTDPAFIYPHGYQIINVGYPEHRLPQHYF